MKFAKLTTRSIKTVIASVFLIFSINSIAVEASDLIKNNIYKSCNENCNISEIPELIKKYKLNEFVHQSYCSCFCSRSALKISNESVDKLDYADRNTVINNQEIKDMIKNNAKFCSAMIEDNK